MIRIGDMVEFTPPQDYIHSDYFPFVGAKGIIVAKVLRTPLVQWQTGSIPGMGPDIDGFYDRQACRRSYLTVIK